MAKKKRKSPPRRVAPTPPSPAEPAVEPSSELPAEAPARADAPIRSARPEPVPASSGLRRYASVVAFVSGTCLMVLEVTASRVLAPEFGNTVYLWSAIIGMILAALSLGYRVGGQLAGTGDQLRRLVILSTACALAIAVVPALSGPLLAALAPAMSAEGGAMVATFLLFFLPSALIGALSPLTVKVQALAGVEVGRASGRISALGALGSILGTFATGFVLLPNFGTRFILVTIAVVMATLALVGTWFSRSRRGQAAVAAVAGVIGLVGPIDLRAAPKEKLLFERDGFYHRIRVLEYPSGQGMVRLLELDSTHEGAMAMNGRFMPFWYTRFVNLAPVLLTEPSRAAFVGGGSFTMPERFADMYPSAEIDVYELDPEVVEVGRAFFRLDEYRSIHPITGDARRALSRADVKYDFVFGDAYDGVQWVPFHLSTREYYEVVRDRLTPDGIYMANLISALDPEEGRFFYATARTLEAVFGHLMVFARSRDPQLSQNLVLVASREPFRDPASFERLARDLGLGHLARQRLPESVYADGVDGAMVLTDDYAPVEAMIARPFSRAAR